MSKRQAAAMLLIAVGLALLVGASTVDSTRAPWTFLLMMCAGFLFIISGAGIIMLHALR